jgi:hypothetical protein
MPLGSGSFLVKRERIADGDGTHVSIERGGEVMRMSMILLLFVLVLPCMSAGGEITEKLSGEIYGIVKTEKGVPYKKKKVCCSCKKRVATADTDDYGIYRIRIDARDRCVLRLLSAESVECNTLEEMRVKDACTGEEHKTGRCKKVSIFPSPTRYDMVIPKKGEKP